MPDDGKNPYLCLALSLLVFLAAVGTAGYALAQSNRLHVWQAYANDDWGYDIVKDNNTGCEYLVVMTRQGHSTVAATPLLHTCNKDK